MQIQKRGGRFLSYHHHCGPLLAPGNSQSNRRIPISSLQGSTTAYVSRDLLSHLPISKKDILQWTKVKILCLKAKHNANNTELLTLLTNSLTQPLSTKITHLSLFFFSYFFPKEKNNSSYILVLHSAPQVTTTIAFRRSDWHISMKLKANVLILYLAVKLQLLFRMEKGLAYLRTSLLFLALLISITKGISFTYKTLSW